MSKGGKKIEKDEYKNNLDHYVYTKMHFYTWKTKYFCLYNII